MKVLSVSCSHCGTPAQIEADRNVGFCTYCGAQLFLDDEKQRIELSGQVNVDGILTLDKQIRNIETLFKIGQIEKANTIIEKLTHEYPEDHRVWWLSVFQVISETYSRQKYKFGEGNPERFSATEYYRLLNLLTETIKTIKISLSLAPPDKKHELGQFASKWLSSYLPYFCWAEDRTRLFFSYLDLYRNACEESQSAYYKARRRTRSKALAVLIPIVVFSATFFGGSPTYSSITTICIVSEFFCILWAKYSSRVDHPWSWYRAKSIAQKLPISEEQCLYLFEGDLYTTTRNGENFSIASYSTPSAARIGHDAIYFKSLAEEFSNL